jgi:hypothetical protein
VVPSANSTTLYTGRLRAAPKRREDVVAQCAEDEAVLLDMASGMYFALNPVGSRVWALCDGSRSRAEIAAAICDEFEVGADVAEADIAELLDELEKERLVVEG